MKFIDLQPGSPKLTPSQNSDIQVMDYEYPHVFCIIRNNIGYASTIDKQNGITIVNKPPLHSEVIFSIVMFLRNYQRIELGEYGSCEVCGKRIDEDRLEAVPWTSVCGEHAKTK